MTTIPPKGEEPTKVDASNIPESSTPITEKVDSDKIEHRTHRAAGDAFQSHAEGRQITPKEGRVYSFPISAEMMERSPSLFHISNMIAQGRPHGVDYKTYAREVFTSAFYDLSNNYYEENNISWSDMVFFKNTIDLLVEEAAQMNEQQERDFSQEDVRQGWFKLNDIGHNHKMIQVEDKSTGKKRVATDSEVQIIKQDGVEEIVKKFRDLGLFIILERSKDSDEKREVSVTVIPVSARKFTEKGGVVHQGRDMNEIASYIILVSIRIIGGAERDRRSEEKTIREWTLKQEILGREILARGVQVGEVAREVKNKEVVNVDTQIREVNRFARGALTSGAVILAPHVYLKGKEAAAAA